MINISKEDYDFLKLHIKNIDILVNSETIAPLIDELYDIIVYKGFDKDYFYNDFGKKAQEVYDRILYDNR